MEKIPKKKKFFFPSCYCPFLLLFSLMSKMSDCVIWMFCVLIYLWFAKMTIWKHVAGIVTDPKKKKVKQTSRMKCTRFEGGAWLCVMISGSSVEEETERRIVFSRLHKQHHRTRWEQNQTGMCNKCCRLIQTCTSVCACVVCVHLYLSSSTGQ